VQAAHGLFGLSANQINITQAVFTLHRQTPFGMWFHRKETKDPDAEPVPEDLQLDPQDYDIFINPQLVAATEVLSISYYS
jgi:peptide deformylase